MNAAEEKFAKAMAGAGHRSTGTTAPPLSVVPSLRRGDVHLGDLASGALLGASLKKLMEGRLLIQAASGAGKSWTLRRLLEQTAGLVQQVVVDPEGEFRSLAEEYELVVIDATKLDAAALAIAARRVREHRLSVVLDLSELDRAEQMKMFASFVAALVDAPKAHWYPCLVAVDEAHLFAPFGGQASEATSIRKAAIGALVDLMSRGRKRGLCGAIATQRLARLSKSVVSEVHNFLIGINTLDLDIRRAAETVGWDAKRAFDSLPTLTPGEFVSVGPAFSQTALIAKIGPVVSKHIGAAPELQRPNMLEPQDALGLLDLDGLAEATENDRRILDSNTQNPAVRAVRSFIRDSAFADAGRIFGELVKLKPKGAELGDLARHLKIKPERVAAAIALLDQFAAVEILGDDPASSAARVHPDFFQ